jgi:hypothetical protein
MLKNKMALKFGEGGKKPADESTQTANPDKKLLTHQASIPRLESGENKQICIQMVSMQKKIDIMRDKLKKQNEDAYSLLDKNRKGSDTAI